MTNTGIDRFSKESAYALEDSRDHRRFYDGWAESYDSGFAEVEGYHYPRLISELFLDHAGEVDSPVIDLGCGTGLAGLHFAGTDFVLDGFDISPGMLDVARSKDVYRKLRVVDLNDSNEDMNGQYGGLISCGTFTLGHLGPEALERSLSLGRGGALCVIGINARHFQEAGFFACMERLAREEVITSPEIQELPIYQDADYSLLDNIAKALIFRLGN